MDLKSPSLALSLGDALLLYAIPIACLIALWLGVSLVVYVLAHSSSNAAFKHDLLRKYEAKRRLRSGRKRLSYLYVAMLLLGDNCVQAALLYRMARFFVRHRMTLVAQVLQSISRFATHSDLSPWADIGPGLYLYHGLGTVVGKGARVGSRALLCYGVSIGGRTVIGDDVKVWPGAKVIGRVTVGDHSEIGANAVVMRNVPPHSIVFGVPARLTGKTPGADGEGDAPALSEESIEDNT
jgi:serine O-acetyltransferase